MPLRLTFLLIVIVMLMLFLVGNPQLVPVQFLFWKKEVELYKIVIAAVAVGALIAYFYSGHISSFRRFRKGIGAAKALKQKEEKMQL